MAPELMGYKHDEDEANNRHPVTMAVDIYSFGLLLWAIITGEKPRMHDESLRKPRHPLSQAWRLPNIALCWSLHLFGTDMRFSAIASWMLYTRAMACRCRPSPWVRRLRWGMSPCAGRVWALHITCLAVRQLALTAGGRSQLSLRDCGDKNLATKRTKACACRALSNKLPTT